MSDIVQFLDQVEPARRHREAAELDQFFRRVTGFAPVLYRGGMMGYGRYHYTYESGRSGASLATGFAPRKAKLSIYIMPGYVDYGDILARLGKHTMGKACLYLNKLEDADLNVLEELVRAGLHDLGKRWQIEPT